ncbi:phosphate acetyltransferase [Parasporobacterium paucivorans]|uniref:Phosphate acetyltransferase n=1 Tax=Parasporobacterium paucivorans DSM 15970 TaxID=1122934 RepID=A0A1M6F599_9FIRM|nr:phosphate acetyltransferase [Parasporobacterium paucivorans]SHI92850.1 phosphate acetyltransferase [Parasporobacterium paucivorans DSM 15970]
MNCIESLKQKAKANKKRIVLPESMDRRTFEAAAVALKEDFADIVIIGTDADIKKYGEGLDFSKAEIIDPATSKDTERYIDLLVELRKSKGMTPEEARKLIMEDYMFYACLMVKDGAADGVVSGACHSTANTLRPALQIIKTKPGTKLVSSYILLEVPDCEFGDNGIFMFSDCGLVQNPTSEELSEIAASTAASFQHLMGSEAKVAMLSHSTMGSAKHADVTKVAEAVKLAKENHPEYLIDGELQLDAAIVPSVADMKAPGSRVAGQANVLVFPDLDAGNIGYKLVQRLAKAEAFGPVLQGIASPINDLSRGCSSADIVGVIAITVVQAQAE